MTESVELQKVFGTFEPQEDGSAIVRISAEQAFRLRNAIADQQAQALVDQGIAKVETVPLTQMFLPKDGESLKLTVTDKADVPVPVHVMGREPRQFCGSKKFSLGEMTITYFNEEGFRTMLDAAKVEASNKDTKVFEIAFHYDGLSWHALYEHCYDKPLEPGQSSVRGRTPKAVCIELIARLERAGAIASGPFRKDESRE